MTQFAHPSLGFSVPQALAHHQRLQILGKCAEVGDYPQRGRQVSADHGGVQIHVHQPPAFGDVARRTDRAIVQVGPQYQRRVHAASNVLARPERSREPAVAQRARMEFTHQALGLGRGHERDVERVHQLRMVAACERQPAPITSRGRSAATNQSAVC